MKPNIVETYNPDRTKLTIFSVNQIDTKLNTKHSINDTIYSLNEKKIITFLSNTDKVKAKDIALAVGLSLSTVKGILYKLVRDGVVSTEGTIKDKKYFIIKISQN